MAGMLSCCHLGQMKPHWALRQQVLKTLRSILFFEKRSLGHHFWRLKAAAYRWGSRNLQGQSSNTVSVIIPPGCCDLKAAAMPKACLCQLTKV